MLSGGFSLTPNLQRDQDEENTLYRIICQYRPRQSGKIQSNPGFRIMHEVIQDVGAALRLDAWRVEAQRRNPAWTSLEAFAESKPDQQLLEQISESLATSYVAGWEANLFKMRMKPEAHRDPQNENTLLMQKYFLLYEELSYSINYQDIGRLEMVFPPWIYIFKATGKHKYATAMTKFLTDVHYLYPEGLKYAHSHMFVSWF